ncbi:MAG: glycogen synthase GlgA [Opitutales bacterium]|nr:glycogen synthase GlgA [Opitutales bacterium]
MKILMVAPEVVPFSKVGGLADVAGALPLELQKMGHDVRIICPKFGFMEHGEDWKVREEPLHIYLGREVRFGQVWETTLPDGKTPVYLIEHDEYFDVPTVYSSDYREYEREGYRFALFSRASLDLCHYLDWIPDVIHCHDWTTGLIPAHLNTREINHPLGKAATVLTIHNLQFQGIYHIDVLAFSGLPQSLFKADGLECFGRVNYMKGAIYHSQKVTTVSPTYAEEIKTPEHGFGLQNTLSFKASDLIGVVNGVDLTEWNPKTDKHIPAPFDRENMEGKKLAKAELQKAFGLEIAPDKPLFVMVSRMFAQKGLDVLLQTAPKVLAEMEVQFAIVGSGDAQLEQGFSDLAGRYPGKFGTYIGYNNQRAHLTYAGGDFILMPSRFEPCGLSQMYAMTYGTLPVVRSTGGLVDTVEQYEEGIATGTGFRFEHLNPEALYYTIGWACSTYYDRPEEFKRLRQNAMNQDFSWEKPAKKYEEIYQWAYEARNGALSGA